MSNDVSNVALDSATSVEPATPAWMAVFSLAMGVFGLLTAEYLPASLLTPMAKVTLLRRLCLVASGLNSRPARCEVG